MSRRMPEVLPVRSQLVLVSLSLARQVPGGTADAEHGWVRMGQADC